MEVDGVRKLYEEYRRTTEQQRIRSISYETWLEYKMATAMTINEEVRDKIKDLAFELKQAGYR